jgi:hypothetical protein
MTRRSDSTSHRLRGPLKRRAILRRPESNWKPIERSLRCHTKAAAWITAMWPFGSLAPRLILTRARLTMRERQRTFIRVSIMGSYHRPATRPDPCRRQDEPECEKVREVDLIGGPLNGAAASHSISFPTSDPHDRTVPIPERLPIRDLELFLPCFGQSFL